MYHTFCKFNNIYLILNLILIINLAETKNTKLDTGTHQAKEFPCIRHVFYFIKVI